MLRARFTDDRLEAGCDEAGRGCLAGPVFAAAVILPDDYSNSLLNDSKKLGMKQRERIRGEIEREALAWSVASVGNETIDQINILKASILAMHLALDGLKIRPELILVDGNRFQDYGSILHQCIVGGDGLYQHIAAASVLAKTHRDAYMNTLHEKYPQYQWSSNKGYPTVSHRRAIATWGITPLHRLSFRLNEQLKLPF